MSTVSIRPLDPEYDDYKYFLQGDEGEQFISKAKELYEEMGDVTLQECYEFYAYDYLDLIFQS